jgi:TonB family protein
MSLTQIPSLQETPPEPPPSRSDPSQLELALLSPDQWESAYRQMHDFPTLLIQAQDDLARSRKREAFWMSLFAHALLLLLILHPPDFAKYWFKRSVMLVKPANQNRELTFVEAPPDKLKFKRPDTNKISDKDRIASTKQPQLDRKELKKILDTSRAGRPNPPSPPVQQQPQPPQQAMMQPPPQPQAQPKQEPPSANQMAKLQTPPVNPKSVFNTAPMSASRAITQAANAAAVNHGRYAGDDGDLGLGQRQMTTRVGPEILSDTMGVDFGPYLEIVKREVKRNWYNLIPQSVLFKKGVVALQFSILKNGQVAGLQYVNGSGDVSLDRAAYGGITASDPFPPLPEEFTGPNLTLRFTFFYNLNTDGTPLR